MRAGAEIVAVFNTQAFLGQHSSTLTVTFDQPYSSEVLLSVEGYIRRDVVFDPGRIDLGAVDAGNAAEKSVSVRYAGRSDWQIVDVRSTNTDLEVELNKAPAEAGKVVYDLLVRLKDSAATGYIDDELIIITNDLNHETIPLAVVGRVAPSLSVRPTSLHLGKVASGKTVKKQLVVSGKKPFKILSVECPDECFEFDVKDEAKKVHLIPVIFTADKAGKMVEKIRIVTDLGEDMLPEVTAQVEVTEPVEATDGEED